MPFLAAFFPTVARPVVHIHPRVEELLLLLLPGVFGLGLSIPA